MTKKRETVVEMVRRQSQKKKIRGDPTKRERVNGEMFLLYLHESIEPRRGVVARKGETLEELGRKGRRKNKRKTKEKEK